MRRGSWQPNNEPNDALPIGECGFALSIKPLARKRFEEYGLFQFGGNVHVERFDDEYLTSRFIYASRGICQRDYVIFLSHLFLSRDAP